ncbi:MAG: VanZ family protein [Cellvibrionaceae bacterium]|nr:VanZ family protein [Cellvibrionaceae bacterium]MCV6626907.1 VanZ family protein [Cellvibrionaceae bacterium]
MKQLLLSTAPWRWGLFWLLLVGAAYFSLSPSPGSAFVSIWDKALHFICWGTVGGSLGLALFPRPFGWRSILLLALAASAIEAGQYWVPGRQFDSADLVANALGLIAAAAFWLPLSGRSKTPG